MAFATNTHSSIERGHHQSFFPHLETEKNKAEPTFLSLHYSPIWTRVTFNFSLYGQASYLISDLESGSLPVPGSTASESTCLPSIKQRPPENAHVPKEVGTP